MKKVVGLIAAAIFSFSSQANAQAFGYPNLGANASLSVKFEQISDQYGNLGSFGVKEFSSSSITVNESYANAFGNGLSFGVAGKSTTPLADNPTIVASVNIPLKEGIYYPYIPTVITAGVYSANFGEAEFGFSKLSLLDSSGEFGSPFFDQTHNFELGECGRGSITSKIHWAEYDSIPVVDNSRIKSLFVTFEGSCSVYNSRKILAFSGEFKVNISSENACKVEVENERAYAQQQIDFLKNALEASVAKATFLENEVYVRDAKIKIAEDVYAKQQAEIAQLKAQIEAQKAQIKARDNAITTLVNYIQTLWAQIRNLGTRQLM